MISTAYYSGTKYDFDLWPFLAESNDMFNFRRNQNELDTSLFDPEHDLDLVVMINNARTDREIQSVARMSRARMRARRAQLRSARRPHQPDTAHANGYAPPSSLMRGF